jgi:PPOX class probable F420-dependent enzyme
MGVPVVSTAMTYGGPSGINRAGDAVASSMADPTSVPTIDAQLDEWLRGHHHAVLVTLRRDGSPQSSNVSFAWDGTSARVSVTATRAKSRNVARDPRVVLHVLGDSFWQSVQLQGQGTVTEVTATPGDAVGQELLQVYELIAGPHPDHDEYFAAMVKDQRQVLTVTPTKAVAALG